MNLDAEQLSRAIHALESQREVLGDAVVDAALRPLRDKLTSLRGDLRGNGPLPLEQQRKLVTVLFARVNLPPGADADIEDTEQALSDIWQRLDAIIHEFDGRVDKHIGEEIMAVWGAQIASEDDPEQAVQAALAMLTEFGSALRVGINTGLAVIGEIGATGEYTAIGDTVNTASRMMTNANPGSIFISQNTYRHIAGIFNLETLPPMQVKGKRDLIQAYSVLSARPREEHGPRRGLEGIPSSIIGRDDELELLKDALEEVVRSGRMQTLVVIGEAGLGKTRLLNEFEHGLTYNHYKGRARAEHAEAQKLPFSLFRDLFALQFNIRDNDRGELVCEKMEDGICLSLQCDGECPMKAHFIGQLVGYDFSQSPHLAGSLQDARQIHDRALLYMTEYFRSTCSGSPTVILLEDIHWADEPSLELLDYLGIALSDQPVLIVCSARPQFMELHPEWRGVVALEDSEVIQEGKVPELAPHNAHPRARLSLAPLSGLESRQLIQLLLLAGRDSQAAPPGEMPPEALVELIATKAEGNPYYIEELIKKLIEDGVIPNSGEDWQILPEKLNEISVPPTLMGILQARLDSLPAAQKSILQRASVIGYTFWNDAIRSLAPQPNLNQLLDALEEREFIQRSPTSTFSGIHEYTFNHNLLREVTYESVLKRDRRNDHARAAEWLIARSGERLAEFAGLIAAHYEQAGQTALCVSYLIQAARQAVTRFANAEALETLRRALDLSQPADQATRLQIHLLREQALDVLGERDQQGRELITLRELVAVQNDPHLQAEAALRHSQFYDLTSNYPGALSAVHEALDLAEACQDTRRTAAAHLQWGKILTRQGKYDQARQRLEQALQISERAGLSDLQAGALRVLGNTMLYFGDYSHARQYYWRALEIHRQTRDRRSEAMALNNLGLVELYQVHYPAARAYFEQSLLVCRTIGDRQAESNALITLGVVSRDQQDYNAARRYQEQALAIKTQVGDRWGQGLALNNMGTLSEDLGNYINAANYYQQALEMFRQIGDRGNEAMALSNTGFALTMQGRPDLAGPLLDQARQYCEQVNDRNTLGYTLTNLGTACLATGHTGRAVESYRLAAEIRAEINQRSLRFDSLSGLALAYLEMQDVQAARATIDEFVSSALEKFLEGCNEGFKNYWICYRVLKSSAEHVTAQQILNIAWQELQR
ncbi:MAG TPA: tetratricopeptide repeat protein, partial [Anaerolineaceae bacterium]|nr:tetratricopeptide repeat protein [Anaerolineaceae bacterium]